MEPLATLGDLERFGFEVNDDLFATALLDSVSGAVRTAAGTPISVVSTTVTLPGTREQFLPLVGGPVRAVHLVTLDGKPITDFKLRGAYLWRSSGWLGQHADVEVDYEFGYAPVPADIVKLVCMFVGVGLNAAASGEGLVRDRSLAYESIDDYRYGLRQGDDEVVDPTELPRRVREDLRQRFGGAVGVTGVI